MQEMSSFQLIRKNKINPMELFDIVTRGLCDHHLPEITNQIIKLKGEWSLKNWSEDFKLDILKIYLSETSFQIYTTKEEAESLEKEFRSWDIFYSVGYDWYGGSTYIVGFNYDYKALNTLYTEWLRDKNLSELLNEK